VIDELISEMIFEYVVTVHSLESVTTGLLEF